MKIEATKRINIYRRFYWACAVRKLPSSKPTYSCDLPKRGNWYPCEWTDEAVTRELHQLMCAYFITVFCILARDWRLLIHFDEFSTGHHQMLLSAATETCPGTLKHHYFILYYMTNRRNMMTLLYSQKHKTISVKQLYD